MRFKSLYNPRHVYEGWFECYFIRPWVRQYADFEHGETIRDGFLSLLGWLIVTLGFAGLLMGLVGLLGPDVGFMALYIVGGIWLALSLLPLVALLSRMTKGKKGPGQHPKFLGIDILQTVAAALFFIFGLLMMLTTLNSEFLHPDPGTDDEPDTLLFEDEVVEEPIFTYQDNSPSLEAPDSSETAPEDPDLIPADESFDPTIEEPVVETPDSLYF